MYLYLQVGLTEDVGTFTTILLHCIAHAGVGEMANDSFHEFVEQFHSLVSRCSRVLFDHKSKDEIFLRNVQEAFEVKLIEEERRPVDTVNHLAALGSVRKVMDSTAQISDKKRWAPRKQQNLEQRE